MSEPEEPTRSEREIDDRVVRMLALGREIRAHLRKSISSDHSCLYDENGFPR